MCFATESTILIPMKVIEIPPTMPAINTEKIPNIQDIEIEKTPRKR